MDAWDIPALPAGRFTKIVSLEQAEHIGVRKYQTFMRKIYDLLDDDGIFVLQVAGLRPSWQYEDLIWYVSVHIVVARILLMWFILLRAFCDWSTGECS